MIIGDSTIRHSIITMTIEDAVQMAVQQLYSGAHLRKATFYLSPHMVVKASRCHKHRARERSATIVVTIGKPNYAERVIVRKAIKARGKFPFEGRRVSWSVHS